MSNSDRIDANLLAIVNALGEAYPRHQAAFDDCEDFQDIVLTALSRRITKRELFNAIAAALLCPTDDAAHNVSYTFLRLED